MTAILAMRMLPVLVAIVPAVVPGGGPATITIGYTPGGSTIAPVFVAQANGFFARYGLTVSLVPVKSSAQIAALEKGELQVSSVGGPELVNADLGGSSAVAVAVGSDYPVFSLYVAKGITRLQDLSGKTIGVTATGTASDATAKLFLVHFGLLDRVRIVSTGGTTAGVLAALENGVVAGGILGVPWTIHAARAGYVELVNGIKLGVPITLSSLVVTRPYLREHRDIVERLLRAYREAWMFAAAPANEPAVVRVLAAFLKAPPDVAKGTYDYLRPIWSAKKTPTVDPRGIAAALRFSPNPKAKDASPGAFIDNSILESLQ